MMENEITPLTDALAAECETLDDDELRRKLAALLDAWGIGDDDEPTLDETRGSW